MLDPDIPGMSSQRQAYKFFNQIVLTPHTKGHSTPSPLALSSARFSNRATTPTISYAAMAHVAPSADTAMRTYVQQETRLVVHELSATLAREASTMVSNAVSPLREELRKAHEEIATLKSDLALHSTTSKSTLKIVQHHAKLHQAQRDKEEEMQHYNAICGPSSTGRCGINPCPTTQAAPYPLAGHFAYGSVQ